jgi:hypothetical protein
MDWFTGHLAQDDLLAFSMKHSASGAGKENMKMKVSSLEALAHAPPPLLWPDLG